jgi:hypothetical protein
MQLIPVMISVQSAAQCIQFKQNNLFITLFITQNKVHTSPEMFPKSG